jgi:hypothetical protein
MAKAKKITKEQLANFVEETRWERPDNYMGKDFSDFVVVVGRSRDSDLYAESNFEVALERLGGEDEESGVLVARSGHWAVGWVECLLVHTKATAKLKIAYEIKESLDRYPVLDDSDLSEREWKAYAEFAEDEKEDLAEALSLHFGWSNAKSKILQSLAYELNVEAQCYYGNDSCINVNPYRPPSSSDLDQLLTCLENVASNHDEWESSTIFKKILARVEAAIAEKQLQRA